MKKQKRQEKGIVLNKDNYPFLDAVTISKSDKDTLLIMNMASKNKKIPQLIATPLMQQAKLSQITNGEVGEYYSNTDSLMFLSSVLNNHDYTLCDKQGFGESYIEKRSEAFYSSLYTELANNLANIFTMFTIQVDDICKSMCDKYDVIIGRHIASNLSRIIIDPYRYIDKQSSVSCDKLNTDDGIGGINESLLVRLTKRLLISLAASSRCEEEKLYFLNTDLISYMNEINIVINSHLRIEEINRKIVNFNRYNDAYYDDEYDTSPDGKKISRWNKFNNDERLEIINELFDEITNVALPKLHNEIISLYHMYYTMFTHSDYLYTVLPDTSLDNFNLIISDDKEVKRNGLYNQELISRGNIITDF